MAVGKRTSTSEPLTEHDIAERLDKAAQRLLKIMYDLRVNHPELVEEVRKSRYLGTAVQALAYELGTPEWNVSPRPLRHEGPTEEVSDVEQAMDDPVLQGVLADVLVSKTGPDKYGDDHEYAVLAVEDEALVAGLVQWADGR